MAWSFVDTVLATILVEEYTVDVARAHARLLAHVRRAGQPRGAHDLIVAATARTMVTYGKRARFDGLPGVRVRQVATGRWQTAEGFEAVPGSLARAKGRRAGMSVRKPPYARLFGQGLLAAPSVSQWSVRSRQRFRNVRSCPTARSPAPVDRR